MKIDTAVYMEHYGVKGQRWGVRKKRKAAINKINDEFWEKAKANPNEIFFARGKHKMAVLTGKQWVDKVSGKDGLLDKLLSDAIQTEAVKLQYKANKRQARRNKREAKKKE